MIRIFRVKALSLHLNFKHKLKIKKKKNMRLLIFLSVIALTLGSCSKEEFSTENVEVSNNAKVPSTFFTATTQGDIDKQFGYYDSSNKWVKGTIQSKLEELYPNNDAEGLLAVVTRDIQDNGDGTCSLISTTTEVFSQPEMPEESQEFVIVCSSTSALDFSNCVNLYSSNDCWATPCYSFMSLITPTGDILMQLVYQDGTDGC